MMDMRYEIRRQQYQEFLREAEEYRLARELGFSEADALRSIAAKLRAWLSRITSREVTSSDQAFTRPTRAGGASQSSK